MFYTKVLLFNYVAYNFNYNCIIERPQDRTIEKAPGNEEGTEREGGEREENVGRTI